MSGPSLSSLRELEELLVESESSLDSDISELSELEVCMSVAALLSMFESKALVSLVRTVAAFFSLSTKFAFLRVLCSTLRAC